MTSNELRDILRRAFLLGYDCGRLDERDERNEGDLPDNVLSFETHRDAQLRRDANA